MGEGGGTRPRARRLTLHFGEFTADWSALTKITVRATPRKSARNEITQKMRKRGARYTRAGRGRRISLGARAGEREREGPFLFDYVRVYVTTAFRLCYNNNDNCDERRITATAITTLNRDAAAARQIDDAGRDLG